MACFGDVRGSNEKQTKHFVFKYSATFPPNKTIFLGTELVGGKFVRGRDVPESWKGIPMSDCLKEE